MAKRRLTYKGGGISDYDTVSTSSYTPSTFTVTTVTSTDVYEPEFSFYIPNSEFYINTPGVSVSDVTKSVTNFNDGIFYLLNKNNFPIYYNSLDTLTPVVSVVTTNNETRKTNSFNPVGKIRASFIESNNKIITVTKDIPNITTDEIYTYVPYTILYKGNRLGQLVLRILSVYYNNPGIAVFPFESVPFAAAYISENVGDLAKLYYGKTIKSPNKNVGTIDFKFNFQYFDTNPLIPETNPTVKYQEVVISLNTVNTGYVPTAISLSQSAPSTGGYTPPPTDTSAPSSSAGISV